MGKRGKSDGTVRVNALGPVELVVDGLPVDIGRRRVRQLLTMLAATSPQSVSSDAIVGFMWEGDDLPADPLGALRVVVSRLRGLLPDPAALEQRAGNYVLRLQTDIAEHDVLLRQAESASTIEDRIDALERALALWRSARPFGQYGDGLALRATLHRLLEDRKLAQQKLGESFMQVGRPEAAIRLLGPLLVEQPHRELLATTLATALASQGRKQEALQVLGTTRRYIRTEFGLEPSAGLLEVEARILDAPADLSAPTTKAYEAAPLPFVGRRTELETLQSTMSGLTVVLGEPGAGKSALLAEVATRERASGRCVVDVTTPASPQTPTEVSAALLTALAPRIPLESLSIEHRAALGQVAPAVFDAEMDQPLSRELLIDAVGGAIELAAPAAETVILIDDIQWLDRLSVAVLTRALQGDVRVVMFGRTTLGAHVEADLVNRSSKVIELTTLTIEDVRMVVHARLPHADREPTALMLLRRTGGNPLLLSLLVDLMQEGADHIQQLPTDVLVAVQQRLEVLSRRARETVQVAAAFLEPFSPAVLEMLRPSAAADLADAEDARLLRFDRETKRWDFAHQLIAEGAYQLLAEGRRIALHDEISRLIEDTGGTAAEFAVHAGEAAQIDPVRAVVAHRDAAGLFARTFEWDTALLHLEAARRHFADAGLDAEELDASLKIAHGTALRSSGQAGHEGLLIEGASLALAARDAPLAAKALIELCGEGRINATDEACESVVELLDRGLASSLPASLRAELLAVGSTLFLISSEHARAREMYCEALDLSTQVVDTALEGRILSRINTSLIHPDDVALREKAASRLREIAGTDPMQATDAALVRLGVAMTVGDRCDADSAIADLRTAVASRNSRDRQAALCRAESGYARFVGDLESAEDFAIQLLGLERQTVSKQWTLVAYSGLIVAVREAAGRLDELLDPADALASRYPGFLPWQMMATACANSAGDLARVRRDVARYKLQGFGGLEHEVSWWAGLAILSDAIVAADDVEAAAMAYRLLLPQSGLFVWNGASVHRPADHYLSVLAAAAGDSESASRHAGLAKAMVSAAS